MARIRSIKPEFWSAEQIVECSPLARLLFIGMWNFADDNGVIPAKPKTLKMQIFPGDDETSESVQRLLDELSSNGLIIRYVVDGEPYFHITGWAKHQKIDRPSSKYPLPPAKNADCSSAPRRALVEPHPPEGKGKEEEGKGEIPPTPLTPSSNLTASSEPGEGSDDRKAKARSIIAAFDDSIAEVWGAEQRRPHPRPMDIQTALDWVDAGADVEVCRRVFLEVGHRFAESGQPPPGSLKARDRDVRQALTAMAGPDPAEPSRDLLLSSGERAFGFAVRHLPSEQAAALKATANDPAMTDLDRARKAKQMLAEAGMRT